MQESGLLRYTTLTVGRGYSLYVAVCRLIEKFPRSAHAPMVATCMRLTAHLTRTRSQALWLDGLFRIVPRYWTTALLHYRRALLFISQRVGRTTD